VSSVNGVTEEVQISLRDTNTMQFTYEEQVLQHITSYSCLGIKICASGCFGLVVNTLSEKALRAFYAIKSRCKL